MANSEARRINGILVPENRWVPGPPPAGYESTVQIWTVPSTACSLSRGENELLVFPTASAQPHPPPEDLESGWSHLRRGKAMMEKVQSSKPESHGGLQEYLGENELGFARYQGAIGRLDSFLATYPSTDVPTSLR